MQSSIQTQPEMIEVRVCTPRTTVFNKQKQRITIDTAKPSEARDNTSVENSPRHNYSHVSSIKISTQNNHSIMPHSCSQNF